MRRDSPIRLLSKTVSRQRTENPNSQPLLPAAAAAAAVVVVVVVVAVLAVVATLLERQTLRLHMT